MTATSVKVAAAFLAVYPSQDDHRSATPDELEAMQQAWGICVGATAEALESLGELPQSSRLEFYRGCGVNVYD